VTIWSPAWISMVLAAQPGLYDDSSTAGLIDPVCGRWRLGGGAGKPEPLGLARGSQRRLSIGTLREPSLIAEHVLAPASPSERGRDGVLDAE
jgi:hypothetical protein